MEINELKSILEKELAGKNRVMSYDEETTTLRVDHTTIKKGVELDLNKWLAKHGDKAEESVEDAVRFITVSLEAMEKDIKIKGREAYIYPVIRSTSFPTEKGSGQKLLTSDHTAETRVYYALDMGEAYTLLDKDALAAEGLSEQTIKEAALFNLRSLDVSYKTETVAGNTFYFVNAKDGYDASRILNEKLLEEMDAKTSGELAVAVPHQDSLIFADIQNQQGFDVLGQIVFRFFHDGKVPVTALSFTYADGKLEPVFILAKKKPDRN